MSTVMNFVCVLGAILVFCLCVCGGYFIYMLIKHWDDICDRKPDVRSPYGSYSQYYSPGRVTKVALDSDVKNLEIRVSALEGHGKTVDELLEFDTFMDDYGKIIITIPEEIQLLRNEVTALTRQVNELEMKNKEESNAS